MTSIGAAPPTRNGAPLWRALAIQFIVVSFLLGLSLALQRSGAWSASWQLTPWGFVLAVSVLSVLLSLGRLPRWWLPLQALFAPALFLLWLAQWPSWVYLLGFLALWLLAPNALLGRVPLYLSGPSAWANVEQLIQTHDARRVVDLGCGLGGMLVWLAERHPQREFIGVETAWLPYWIARWRLGRLPNVRVARRDLWAEPLGEYDLVFCFLSPQPMAGLWRKALTQMRPGSVLASLGFEVPGVAGQETPSGRHTLYTYVLPDRKSAA